ncbi:MAG TPA: hypothetical protein VM370_01280 [Candidatus Thermoplasmatota archaeon]|nr:hypothetical protein [Candidatus Thermoplasmatota archaeon]
MRLLLLCALVALAGCASPAGTLAPAASDAGAIDGAEHAPLSLSGTGCVWGGGHSIHTMELAWIVPEPWKASDVVEDIGMQPTYSDPGEQIYGVATSGWGNWHTNLACDSFTLDGEETPLTLGMVLARVEPPPFDPAPVARNYIVNVLASDNEELNARLMDAGWMSMGTTGSLAWDDDVFHHVLATEMHGTYESLFHTSPQGSFEDKLVRLWFQKQNDDGTFAPIALDMKLQGDGERAIADPEGWFTHTGTDDHVVLAGQPNGAYGQIAGLVVSGIDVDLSWGPTPDVRLDEAYEHL